MARAQYDDIFWFPTGVLAANIPARVFPQDSNTLAVLYAGATGSTTLANPLNTDNAGRLRFWVEAGHYWIHIDSESFLVPIGVLEGDGVTPEQLDAAIAQHNADHTDVHGIPDTADLETTTGAQAKADAARDEAENYSTDELNQHAAQTLLVHGIADTADLETQQGAQTKADTARDQAIAAAGSASSSALADHIVDTTNVHGITNTALLETQAGAQTKANAAGAAAVAVAAADAQTKANTARDAAILTASDDATAKADAARSAAISAAASDATTKANAVGATAAAALSAHATDTTDVHGIPDTSLIPSSAEIEAVADDLAAHEAATTNVHGIPDTSTIPSNAQMQAVADELAAHEAATTNVHGIPDTSTIPSSAQMQAVADDLAAHEADTTNVHGIPDTAALETTTGAQAKADTAQDSAEATAAAALALHEADTTNVHGIANTASLETTTGAQAKADAAQAAAISAAASDATTKANAAQAAAISAAATDATTKANNAASGAASALAAHEADTTNIHGIANTALLETGSGAQAKADAAQAAAISAAASDATTKANAAQAAAISAAASDATTKANNAASGAATALAAHEADTTNIHGIANTALLETGSGAQAKADAAQAAAISAAATDATTKANNAQAAAISAAATDATTKANNAQAAAISAAATDATTKANNAASGAASALAAHEADTTNIHGITNTALLETGSGAQAKADAAQAAAISAAATDATTKANNAASGAASALASHEADTTNIHGITNTALLETGSGAQAKADAAQAAAIADAATKYLNKSTGGNVVGVIREINAAGTTAAFATQLTGQTFDWWRALTNGQQEWGSGTAAREIILSRTGTGQLQLVGSLDLVAATSATVALGARVSGDSADRLTVDAAGNVTWGPGTGAGDTHLRRTGVGILTVDEAFTVGTTLDATGNITTKGTLQVRGAAVGSGAVDIRRLAGDAQPRFYQTADGGMWWGDGTATIDTSLYRDQDNSLVTDSNFTVGGDLYLGGQMINTVESQMEPLHRYETIPRMRAGSVSTITSGQLVMVPIYIGNGVNITNIAFVSGSTAGATLTNQWFILLDQSFGGLARTANASTAAWAANSVKSLAIAQTWNGAATNWVTQYAGLYYLGIMVTATTMPNFIGEGTIPAAVASVFPAFGGGATGLSTTPTVTAGAYTATTPTGSGYALYAYVVTT